MTDNIDVVVKESGSQGVVTSFDQVAASAQRAHKAVSDLQKLFGNVGRSTAAANRVNALGTAAQGATGHVRNLNTAMTSLNNTRVTASLNSANTALNNTATSSRNAATGVRDLLAAFISFQAIKNVVGTLIEAQVAMQQIHFGLLAATGSSARAGQQFEYLRENANRLGLDLQTSAQEYTRLAASADAMNVSMEDQQKLYTSLSQASTVLHLDAQKVQFATLALTQMFSKSKIQAEELRRQLGEAIPGVVPRFQRAVMEVIKDTDLAKYSFEDLMKRGLLDTARFLPQLTEALGEVGRSWEPAAKGLNAEINRLKTAWFELKVQITDGLFTDVLITAVRFLSRNLKELIGVVTGLGVAIGIALAPAAIIKFTGYVKALGLAVWAAAGPWGILAGVILGVGAAIISMRDDIKVGVDEVTTLGDMMAVAWDGIKPALSAVAEHGKMILGFLTEEFVKSFKLWTGFQLRYETQNEASWIKVMRFIAQTLDMIAGLIRGMYRGAIAATSIAIEVMMDGFKSLGQAAMALLKGDFEGIASILSGQMVNVASSGARMGEAFSDAFRQEVLRQDESGVESLLDGWIRAAQARAAARTAQAAATGGNPTGGTTPPASDPTGNGKAAKELERLKNALARLIGEINPTENALRKLAEAQEILDQAVNKNLLTQERATWVMDRLRDKYKEVLDPLGFLVDKYREEREILQYTGDEYEVQSVVLSNYHRLKKANYDITREMVENALRPEIEATQAATRAQQAYNNVLQQTIYARRAEIESLQAVAAAKKAGDITGGQAAQQVVGIFGEEAMQHTAEYAAAMLQTHLDFYAKVEEARNLNLISHQTANMLMAQADAEYTAKRLSYWSNMFGQLATLSSSGNKKLAKIGKAAAIAQAVIDGVAAVQKAWASAPYPYNLPAVAVTTVAQAANVASIMSQDVTGFRTGGSMTVGGSGGPDSQLVQFYATPGENIHVNTPAQARAMEDGGGGDVTVNSPISVAVVQDREAAFAMMRQDPNMRQWVIEVIEENNGTVARAIGVK